jgi:hypothetical protein
MKISRKGVFWSLLAVGGFTFAAFILYTLFSLFFWRPSDLHLSAPEKSVADARALIAEFRAERKQDENYWSLPQDRIPESLRIPKMRGIEVLEDHVNLIMARHPDGMLGARIWSADASFVHEDKPTKYTDVFYFFYNNDFPDSPSNKP